MYGYVKTHSEGDPPEQLVNRLSPPIKKDFVYEDNKSPVSLWQAQTDGVDYVSDVILFNTASAILFYRLVGRIVCAFGFCRCFHK